MIDNQQEAVLVTGGAGFIGSYVVRDLLHAGARVIAYDLFPDGNALPEIVGTPPADGRLRVARGTVIDGDELRRICNKHRVSQIVHLASPLTQDVNDDPLGGVRNICEGTATVFEVARECRVRRVVWASSVAVFGARSDYPPGPLANDAAHRPTSLYGSCKSLCEQMASTYRENSRLDTIGLRLTVVYGPGRLRGYMSFPSELIRAAAFDEAVEVPIADQPINWQYVGDVAALIVHALAAPAPRDLVFNTWGDVRTFREAGELLQQLAPNVSVAFSEDPVDDGHRALLDAPSAFDDSELRQQLGYAPAFTLERGLRDSFRAFRRRAREAPAVPEDSRAPLVARADADD